MTGIINNGLNHHAVRLTTPRLVLREHRADDLTALHAILSDPATTWYLPGMYKRELVETEAYLRSVMRDAESHHRLRYNLAVEDRRTGALLGSVGLHVIESAPQGAHYGLGYFLRPDVWNQGYATEAARATLAFIFQGNACRVSASCLAENIGSRRVAEKCGMTQEGLLRAHTWHDGQWKDCAVYRLLREEFSIYERQPNV
jgi:RimJ/RimL family protein N-acetyltransferase